MIRRLCHSLLLLALVIAATPALTADPALKLRHEQKNMLPGEMLNLQSPNDFAKAYNQACVNANADPSLNEYVALQCACTAAEMTEFMTPVDLQALTGNGDEAEFQRARLMMLGYIPCMKAPVRSLVLDQCLSDDKLQKTVRRPRRVCACMANGLSEYATSKGQNIIPGFRRGSYDSKKAAANPLAFIIRSRAFERQSDYHLARCLAEERYNR